jgi:hypothetical protein
MNKITTLVLLFLAFSYTGKSSHISFAEMTYKSLGTGYDYEFTVTLYADCGVLLAPNDIQLNFCSVICGKTGTFTLDSLTGTGKEIFPLCSYPGSICKGGVEVGYKKHEYKGHVTLPRACSDWMFTLNICCRSALINTIESPGTEGSVIMLKVDNLNYPTNNSPVFKGEPIVFACINELHEYDQSATDVDGDSLDYHFYTPNSRHINCVTPVPINYKSGFGPSNPITTTSPILFNNKSGKITMEPAIIERGLMGIRVDEYRKGKIIGSIYRDNMISVTTERLLLGLQESTKPVECSFQPNPSAGKVQLYLKVKKGNLRFYNLLGQQVFQQYIDSELTSLDISMLPAGSYFAVIQTSDGLIRKQFMKE